MSTAVDSQLRKLALAAVIAVGLSAVWFLLVATLFGLIQQSFVSRDEYEQLYVRYDGEPVLARIARTGLTREIETLDRQPAAGDAYSILHPAFVAPADQPNWNTGRDWMLRLASISDGGSPAVYWYLVHDGRLNGRAYGVGYHSVTKRIAGYFSRDGFSEALPPRETWFEVVGNSGLAYATPDRTFFEPYYFHQPSMFLLANGQVWKIDTRKRDVTSIMQCPDGFAIGWAWQTTDELPPPAESPTFRQANSAPRKLLVRSPDACLLKDPAGGEVERYPLPTELQPATIAGFQLADEQLLLVSHSPHSANDRQLTWIDREGQVTREKKMTLQSSSLETSEATAAAVSGVIAPALGLQSVALFVFAKSAHVTRRAESIPAAMAHALRLLWPPILLNLAIGAGLAWSAYRRQRRFGLPGAVSWALFIMVFGIAGWFAYRWHRVWPVIEDCPHCRQPAPRDREECTECGAEYPPPALKGTEVFA